jgi:AraC-like DNA-binding protein
VRYAEYRPSAALADVVRCIWTLEGRTDDLATAAQPILPDGRPEIVVHLGDPFELIHDDNTIERQPRTIFAGQLTSPLIVRPTGKVAVVGIRFRADGVPALIHGLQHRLAGLPRELGDLSTTLARELTDVCARQTNVSGAAGAVDDCLQRHLNEARIDPHVRLAVATIRRRHGAGTVDDIANAAGVSRRHLERRFQDVVGLSPKRFARIARFQQALRTFEKGATGRRGALTAAACGYADQAHFIRDFSELAGCSPEAHLLRDAMLNRLFAGPDRPDRPDRPE